MAQLTFRGTFQASVVSYASEITPVALRGYLTVSPQIVAQLTSDLRQLVLDYWPIPRRRYPQSHGQPYRRVGLPNPLCHSMGLANSPHRPHPLCSRVTMVPRSSWQNRRSRAIRSENPEERLQSRPLGDRSDDGQDQRARIIRIRRSLVLGLLQGYRSSKDRDRLCLVGCAESRWVSLGGVFDR